MKQRILSAGLLVAPLLAAACQASSGCAQLMPQRPPSKTAHFLHGRLPVGFYIYLYSWKQYKDPTAHDLDDAIEQIAGRGFNYLYVGGTSDTPLWRHVLELCAKHRIAVVPQLDFVYLANPAASVDHLVARAVPFIKQYKDHPALMAFSVREEPNAALMPALKRYYEGILREVPDAPLHLVHDYLEPLKIMEPPFPGMMGTDRYPFWWEMSGHRATPAYALNWYRTQLAAYYQLTVARGAEFQAVCTACASEQFITPERLKASFYSSEAPEARERFYRNTLALAAQKNQGWDQAPPGNLRFWKYYRPPANCMRAMSWLAIMEGARSIANWAWAPPPDPATVSAYRQAPVIGRGYDFHINAGNGRGTPQLDEYAEFASQIQRYARLIRVMTKENVPLDPHPSSKVPGVVASPEGGQAAFTVAGNNVAWQSFSVPGYAGKVIVLVNTAVGTWCDGRSPALLTPHDRFRIDDFGEAVDYTPYRAPRELTCQVGVPDAECIDLATTQALMLNAKRSMVLPVVPGGGRFLFLDHNSRHEWPKFRQEFGL